jgi:hypothetical protein
MGQVLPPFQNDETDGMTASKAAKGTCTASSTSPRCTRMMQINQHGQARLVATGIIPLKNANQNKADRQADAYPEKY